MRNPIDSTGWVIRQDAEALWFAGTCFGLRRPDVMVTAKHVVEGATERDVSVTILLDDIEEGISVRKIVRHASADVAIHLIDNAIEIFDYFIDIGPRPEMGANVTAFGYPEDTQPSGPRPTPRFFKGHVQRTHRHNSLLGHSYIAAELSFGAPGGLSGGPVAHEALPGLAIGVVAENHESSTYLASRTDVLDGGVQYREDIRAMINYANCVLLEPLRPWFDEHVPPVSRDTMR
jgi:hypothetical protein